MDDLEMTKRCAEAMNIGAEVSHGKVCCYEKLHDGSLIGIDYDPLQDDAQAMALVKKFGPSISGPSKHDPDRLWYVYESVPDGPYAESLDLNRAICECVAKMQLSAAPSSPKRAQEAG